MLSCSGRWQLDALAYNAVPVFKTMHRVLTTTLTLVNQPLYKRGRVSRSTLYHQFLLHSQHLYINSNVRPVCGILIVNCVTFISAFCWPGYSAQAIQYCSSYCMHDPTQRTCKCAQYEAVLHIIYRGFPSSFKPAC